MTIDFDPIKDQANIAKHGLSLARAAELNVLAVVADLGSTASNAIVSTGYSTTDPAAWRRCFATASFVQSASAAPT